MKKNRKKINIVSPVLPKLSEISTELREILKNGHLTNNAKYVPAFEKKMEEYLGVKHCVALANGMLALVLALKAMGLKGEVILPSFTFSATAHAVVWAGLTPVFADIDPETFNIDPEDIERKITPETCAILPVNTYGNVCNIEALNNISEKHNLKVLYDSAHALGTVYKGRRVGGSGSAEMFSFHATKILPAGEGGLISTNDTELYEKLLLYRVFGAEGGDNDCILAGFNGKMPEFSAILALKGLSKLDHYIKTRKTAAERLYAGLKKLKGIKFQEIHPGTIINHQYFPVIIDENEFGASRDEVFEFLKQDDIIARKYFYPPIHKYTCYNNLNTGTLENTEYVSERIMCLPFYSDMKKSDVNRIIKAFKDISRRVKK
ncbi:MAG: DegT/DnrJ/EryC1/StrS family aminotransferase [Armatimonadota bacterium]